MKTKGHLMVLHVLLSVFAFTHAFGQTNFRIHPSSNHQGKLYVAPYPLNPNMMFAVGTTTHGYGRYFSTDGGMNWSGTDSSTLARSGKRPAIIDRYGHIMVAQLGSGTDFGLYVVVSLDFGATWLPRVSVPAADLPDVVALTTDDAPLSPYCGRSYIAWTSFGSTYTNRIVLSYTPNGGSTWSVASPVSPPSSAGHFHHGCDIRVGPNGSVYVVWANTMQSGSLTEDSLGVAVSTNGGVSWMMSTNSADDMNGIRSTFFFNGLRVNGFPQLDIDRTGGPRNGWIYVVAAEKSLPPQATDLADIVLHRSTNGGLTWTRTRVNQDSPGNGKYQFYPSLVVDDASGVSVLYLDSRNIATNDSTEAFVSRSTDGGSTWTDIRASDHRFKPKLVGTPQAQFDFNGTNMVSTTDHLLPSWSDDITGTYQIWASRIVHLMVGGDDINNPENGIVQDFSLSQNYPNPFNPETKIGFRVSGSGWVSLKVFDMLGREVATLVNEEKAPSIYEMRWDAGSLASGVYFYQLQAGGFVQSKKLLLLR
jgi:hypothetical protein